MWHFFKETNAEVKIKEQLSNRKFNVKINYIQIIHGDNVKMAAPTQTLLCKDQPAVLCREYG